MTDEISLRYKIPDSKTNLRLFGEIFVKNNIKNCNLLINNKKKN